MMGFAARTFYRGTTVRLLLVLSLVLASAFAAVPAKNGANAEGATRDVSLGSFEDGAGDWTFGNGAEFPGATGSFVQDGEAAHTGDYAGKLTADFSGGGSYVAVGKSFSPLDIQSLSFWVRTSDIGVIGLRMVDSTGQFHQQRLVLDQTADWQQVTVTDFGGGYQSNYWGGANDGVWHGPAKQIYLLMDKSRLTDGKKVGVLRIDDVTAAVPMPSLQIGQTKVGSVFSSGEDAVFSVMTQGDAIESKVFDYWGAQVAERSDPAIGGQAEIRIPGLGNGYYTLQVTALQDGSPTETAENSFAVLSPFDLSQVTDSPFGMATHFGQSWNPELIPVIQQAGAKNIRDELYWNNVEPQKGVYDFPAKYDKFMSELASHQIKPFTIFSYTNPNYDNDSTPYTDEGRQGYAQYGNAVIGHYGDQTEWVEVYNEFNIAFGDRGDGPADSKPEAYFELLKTTYETVKASHPNVTVVGAATAGIPWDWLETLFQLGGLQYMDAVSIHPYRYPADPASLDQDLTKLEALIRQYNDGNAKPIWITEMGWPTQTGSRGVDEGTQARYIVQSHVISLAAGVQKIFWYDFKNDGLDPANNEHNFGIVRNEADPQGAYAPKPAYVAYAAMTRLLTGKTFSHREELGDGLSSYVFEGGNGPTRVLWSAESKNMRIKTDGPLQVTDLMGNEMTFQPMQGGYVYLTVTPTPVFIEGEWKGISEETKFSLTGSQATAGSTVTVVLKTDNTEPPLGRVKAEFEIQGQSAALDVMPHRQSELRVEVPGADAARTATLFGYIRQNGKLTGKLTTEVNIVDPVRVQAKHVLREGKDALDVGIRNNLAGDYRLDRIDWTIGGESGTAEGGQVVSAGMEADVSIPVPEDLPTGESYPVALTLYSEDAPSVGFEGTITLVAMQDMKSSLQRTVDVDGALDDLSGVPAMDLAGEGTVKMSDYAGADDLSGDLWLTWDADNLYLSAAVQDDVFSQTASADGIWQGDSIQFALSQGTPGESAEWYEYGVALTGSGPQVYRWSAAAGLPAGLVESAAARIVRDEPTHRTVYELALPWSELQPITSADGLLSFSVLVNDNDGAGRKGWIEWGSGIGESKSNQLFVPIRLIRE